MSLASDYAEIQAAVTADQAAADAQVPAPYDSQCWHLEVTKTGGLLITVANPDAEVPSAEVLLMAEWINVTFV